MTNLELTFRQSPFVRILAPFAAGIISVDATVFYDQTISLSLGVICFIALCFFKKTGYANEPRFGILLFFTLFFLGHSWSASRHLHPEEMERETFFSVLDDYPEEKNNSFKSIVRIVPSNRKVLTYLEKTSDIESARPGYKIIFNARPQIIENKGNPNEFDYKTYLLRRKIGHRVFLKKESFRVISDRENLTFRQRALVLRENLIGKLKNRGLKGVPLNVVSAVVLGSKDDLEPGTKKSFSRSGAMHVLAVSGLHVGIIYVVLGYFLNLFFRSGRGNIVKLFLLLSGLWFYAFISGLSPSVMRASTMFSLIAFGNNINRRPNIYNSLAASAFILLLTDPNLIYDAGFQLSYSAVTAIIYLQPKLYRSLYFRFKLFDKVWALTTVSIAAQIGTMPLTLYYFHQFPVYFWVSNLITIPLVTLILYSALLFFVFEPVNFIAGILVLLLEKITGALIKGVEMVESMPLSVIENIPLTKIEMLFLFGLIISLTWSLSDRKRFKPLPSLLIITLLLSSFTYNNFRHLTQKKIVFFNVPGQTLLMFINAENAVIYSSGNKSTEELDYYLNPVLIKQGINSADYVTRGESYVSHELGICIHKDFAGFYNTRLIFLTDDVLGDYDRKKIPESDIILISTSKHNTDNLVTSLLDRNKDNSVIVDGSAAPETRKILQDYCLRNYCNLINVNSEGGVSLNIK